jgi:site-specific DNA-methyltransferase (adenine-specific)
MSEQIKLVCGDNLTLIKGLEDDSVDMIYFNPPFNVFKDTEYDKISLNWIELWPEMWRVLKPGCAIVIHASQPFTYDLIASQRKFFKYCYYWNKQAKTGHLISKKQPMRCVEEIVVFYKPKMNKYNPILSIKDKPTTSRVTAGNYFPRNKDQVYTNNFNYKDHLLVYKRRSHKYSTRPIELCEFIINTYTQEGDTVLDLTCSDAQSGIACRNIKRNYIGFDISADMICDAHANISKKRKIVEYI